MGIRDREAVHAECDRWGEERVQVHVNAYPDDADRIYRLEWLNAKAQAKEKSSIDSEWTALSEEVRAAIEAAWRNGVPPLAAALYVRWWQLETWLRSLVYVELKSLLGHRWVSALPNISESRQLRESEFQHMSTPDGQSRLAYTDASVLFKITQDNWTLFEKSLLPKNVWNGRVEELRAIRNRIGHCRRPHFDDLTRLEQTLRDLERGAFVATSAFNRQWRVHQEWVDTLTDGWVREKHEDARRLIAHADRQYETSFRLLYSRRPWAEPRTNIQTISGVPGYLWHAQWQCRGRPLDLDGCWRDMNIFRDLILFVCADGPSSMHVSFSALEDPDAVANAIGACFDAVLSNLNHYGPFDDDYAHWSKRYVDLDPQVQVATPWSLVEDAMERYGVSIFGAFQ